MCYSSKLLVALEHQRINIIVSYTLAIAQTCRTGKKGCEWHVCDTLWCLAGQWRGNSRFFFCSVSFYGIFSGVLCLISILAYP